MRIAVIGGGASGMMAAITAARLGANVTVLEHTARVGKKILSTGNGKCNFTNQYLSKDDYNGDHPSFAEPALSKFDAVSAVHFFEECGMPADSKRDGYFYPHTGQASTVLNTLRLQMEVHRIRVKTECYIDRIQKSKDGQFQLICGRDTFVFDKIILACGGNAAPSTGSDGSGYGLAKSFGHKIVKPMPVLTYLKSKESFLKELAGVRAGAKVSLFVENKLVQTEVGELQLNKDNVSGIPVFQLSHAAIRALDEKKQVSVTVDFLPETEEKDLFEKFDRHLSVTYPEVPVTDILAGIVHKKVGVAILRRCRIPFEKTMQELSKKEMSRIVSMVKEFMITVNGFPGFEAAQATMGGVDTVQIDPNTMMSRKIDGLYFAGEIIDIDGRCGGYNLQWAWSSGYVAGCHSAIGEVKCYESTNVK